MISLLRLNDNVINACAGYVQLFILFRLYRTRVHLTQKGLCSHYKLRCIDGSPDGIAINRQSEVRFLLECKAPLAWNMRYLSLRWSWFDSLFYSKQGCSSNPEEASWFLFLDNRVAWSVWFVVLNAASGWIWFYCGERSLTGWWGAEKLQLWSRGDENTILSATVHSEDQQNTCMSELIYY